MVFPSTTDDDGESTLRPVVTAVKAAGLLADGDDL
jgi:hypothetical protein